MKILRKKRIFETSLHVNKKKEICVKGHQMSKNHRIQNLDYQNPNQIISSLRMSKYSLISDNVKTEIS